MSDDIAPLRREIDALDDELLALLNRRADLARRIGALKQGAPAYRPERESEILRRVGERNPGALGIRTHRDREGGVAFHSVRFASDHRITYAKEFRIRLADPSRGSSE